MATRLDPNRHNEMTHCDNCGEDYSVTYKACPFCNETPDSPRAGAGRRVAPGGSVVNPMDLFKKIASGVIILCALVIVVTTVAPMLGGSDSPDQSQPASSQVDASVSTPTGDVSDPAPSISGDPSVVVPNVVSSIKLDKQDFTLKADEQATLKATVDPADAAVTWSSSNEAAAVVDANGVVTNVNTGSSQVKVTITAAAGDKTAVCTVYCKGGSAGSTDAPVVSDPVDQPPVDNEPDNNVTPLNKKGKVSGASSGLNVRSGPASTYERIASLNNGVDVTVVEDCGNGWYKITFSGMGGVKTEGYVSKDYIQFN